MVLKSPWDQPPSSANNIGPTRIPTFLCPSEVNDTVRTKSGQPYCYPLNYGVNCGAWFVFDPVSGNGGDGAFFPNAKLGTTAFTDGMSNTLLAAEVKAFTPYGRNMTSAPSAIPADVAALVLAAPDKKMGAATNDNTGHTEWPDGRVPHGGFTTVLPPNTRVSVIFNGQEFDADFNTRQEGSSATVPTYAAVTSRSYHTGGVVNVAMMDGSVRSVTKGISQAAWRAVGTRAGGEILGLD